MPHHPDQPPTSEQALALVRGCSIFEGVDEGVLAEAARALEWWCVPGGETFLDAAAEPRGLYLVLHGRLRVTHAARAVPFVQLAAVGDPIGAVGLLRPATARYTVLALQDSEVALLPREAFVELAACDPALWRRLSEEVEAEVEALLQGRVAAPRARQVAILPAGPDDTLDEFVRDFTAALEAHAREAKMDGAVKLLDRAAFRAEVGSPDDAITVWDHTDRDILTNIEGLARRSAIMLFRADAAWTDWTQRCIRESDSVLIVSRASADREVGDAERALLGRARREHGDYRLVLLHPRGATDDPAQTAEWLDRRPGVDRVHHVRLGRREHYARLARHLMGHAVGLVLGGGGARGQAHLGVVKALRDCGVHVDAVGGTSAGGGIAALTTYEQTRPTREEEFEETKRRVRHAFVDLAPFAAFSLPFHSLMRKPAVEAPSKFLSGERWIEDLWLPFFCVSCDIRERKRVVHRRGKLWKALCATTALPGVLPPVVMRGMILVDGGVVDNVPVDPMRETTAGPLIVVDVGAPHTGLIGKKVLDLPVNAAVILSHVHPLLEPITVPSLLTIVTSTMVLADTVRLRQKADLTIVPDIGRFGMTEFEAQEELVAIGYNAALAALRALPDETLARLGTERARLDLPDMPEPHDQREKREERARLRRAFARGAGVLVLGLAVAGALQSATAAVLALVLALLVPVLVLLSPLLAPPAPTEGAR